MTSAAQVRRRLFGSGNAWATVRRRRVGALVIVGLAGVIGAWAQVPGLFLAPPVSAQQDPAARAATAAESLFVRCTRAMVQGSCQVMGAAASPTAGTSQLSQRVFVAGVGEVDAAVYERLRRLGDAMCSDVQRACEQDWQGSECRVAQALYPPTR
jgi:hypothetical protein